MIVRQVHTPSGLLAILAQSTAEMQALRRHLSLPDGRFPCRRTWERRLAKIPEVLPAKIACIGRFLVIEIQVWIEAACAAAIDSTVLRACGGVWHKKDREAGVIPHSSIDTEAHWTKSAYHGWVYGWKLHLVVCAASPVWLPLAADLTSANVADNEQAPALIAELPDELRFLLGDQHYNDETLHQQFKVIFDVHGQVVTKGLVATRRFALSAVLVYKLAVLYCFLHDLDLRVGLKALIKSA